MVNESNEFPQSCIDAVAKLGGVLCSSESCRRIEEPLLVYCRDVDAPAGTPVPQIEFGAMCYCCCGGSDGQSLTLLASETERVSLSSLSVGDHLLTGSTRGEWAPRSVQYVGHVDAGWSTWTMVELRHSHDGVTSRAWHRPQELVLMSDGTLSRVGDLRVSDTMARRDGSVSLVESVQARQRPARGAVFHLGPFDGANVDGHLVDVDGLIMADFMVQIVSEVDGLDPALRHQRDGRSPSKIPRSATAYLTDDQAADIDARNSGVGQPGNVEHLFTVYGAAYPDITFGYEPDNGFANVYAWRRFGGKRFVTVTGTPGGIEGLGLYGLSVWIATMIASLDTSCLARADYDAGFSVLRDAWPAELFFVNAANGSAEVEVVFGYVEVDHAGSGRNACRRPSVDCRLTSLQAGIGMLSPPVCITGAALGDFAVVEAASTGLESGTVTFSIPVDPATGSDPVNYVIDPLEGTDEGVDVVQAQVTSEPTLVVLTTGPQTPGALYRLTVTGVLDASGGPIDELLATYEFRTPDFPAP